MWQKRSCENSNWLQYIVLREFRFLAVLYSADLSSLPYCTARNQILNSTVLEFLNNLLGLGTSRTGPPGYEHRLA
jgi:hypothetical protein